MNFSLKAQFQDIDFFLNTLIKRRYLKDYGLRLLKSNFRLSEHRVNDIYSGDTLYIYTYIYLYKLT